MILQRISLSWLPTSLHLKPCTCSAQWLQKASAPWTFLLALLFRALALLPSVIPPENLGSHKEFSVEPGSVCASQSVCRCQSSQLWSRILYSVLHSLVSSKKGKKNPQTIVFLHILLVAGIPVLIKWLLSLCIEYGSQQPCPTRFICFSPQWDNTISCVCISSTLSHYQLHYKLRACSHIGLKVFFFPWKSTTVRSPGTGLLGFHMVCLLTQLQSGSGPASVSTFHRSHADVTLVFYTGDFYLFIYFNPKKE